jgi:hypothetical protein
MTMTILIRAHDDIIDISSIEYYICIMDSWSQTLTVFILSIFVYLYLNSS